MSQNVSGIKAVIAAGKAVLGIELGSTRIKSVLIGEDGNPIASGGYEWNISFNNQSATTIEPDPEDVTGFESFMYRYKQELSIERAAVDALR